MNRTEKMNDKVASRLREFIRRHEVITDQGGIVTACDGAVLTLEDLRVAVAALESMSAASSAAKPGPEAA